MLEDYSTRTQIVLPIAAALILLAAVVGAFAANNTGPRPVSTGAGNPFGINSGVGSVGAESGGGGSPAPTPPPIGRRGGGGRPR